MYFLKMVCYKLVQFYLRIYQKVCLTAKYTAHAQWNLDLMKCQGTGVIGLLYRGSVPYIL